MSEEGLSPSEYNAAMDEMSVPNGFVEFTELMVEDDNTPTKVQNKYWGFLNKQSILSRTERGDRVRSENRFAILRNLEAMSMKQYDITIPQIMVMQNAQNLNTIETNRSIGGFERQALTTQIKQIITNKSLAEGGKEGFLSGLKSKLGFGKKQGGEENAS